MTTMIGYGEPFDPGFEEAERHLGAGDLAAAQGVYERLLAAAGAFDSVNGRLLRADLLANLAMVHTARQDLAAAAAAEERALRLLRDLQPPPELEVVRQLRLDFLLKVLICRADRLRLAGRPDQAQECLDEAAGWLPGFTGDGTRDAELGNAQVSLLIDQGAWGAAELLVSAVLATVPPAVTTVPYLLTNLGRIHGATGRFDAAEDSFARAADAFVALGDTGEQPSLLLERGRVAALRGDLDRAEPLYRRAAACHERRGQPGELALVEQVRGELAAWRGDTAAARNLLTASHARSEGQGMPTLAASAAALAAQLAYRRGDDAPAQLLFEQARAGFAAAGLHRQCAWTDYLLAACVEERIGRTGTVHRVVVDTALGLALPAALALEAVRYDIAASEARSRWQAMVGAAMRLVFRLAGYRMDPGLLFELVEFRCAGAPLAPGLARGLRVAEPPRVLMPSGRTALQEYVAAAEDRYHQRIVGDTVVSGPTGRSDRPVVQVRFADAGDAFLTWCWLSGGAGSGTGRVPESELTAALAALADAVPTAGDGIARAFGSGAMAGYDTEVGLARRLAWALWPVELTGQLRAVSAHAGRPLVRIQPSPRVAQVPWELLAVDGETRLVDLADVVTTVPVSLRPASSPPVPVAGRSDAVVAVLDPEVPGYPAGSALGSVLGRPDPALTGMVRRYLDAGRLVPAVATAAQAFRRGDLDRDWLGAALRAGPGRLIYVGHATQASTVDGQSEDAQLHLCCGPATSGVVGPHRRHRPLSARDLFVGSLTIRPDGVPGARLWPAPPRVALIACESGGDLRFGEPFGLSSALIHNGAELVTATRWALPTDHAFHRLAGLGEAARPLAEAIVAVDLAHEHADPVGRLGDWQRDQLACWRSGCRIEHSPLVWAAVFSISR